MISIKKLKLKNFLSHADTEIVFKDDHKILIDGKSGSGKSSIVEALIWGLYGVARVDSRNLVKKGSHSATVSITLQDGDKTYRIDRGTTDKAKNTLSVYSSTDTVNFKPIERTGLRDTQEWIETDLLRASYPLFINSVAYPQDNVDNFVKQTAAKRKDLLLEIANVKDFDRLYSRAKEELSLRTESIGRIEYQIGVMASTINRNKMVVDQEEKIKAYLAGMEKELAEEEARLKQIEEKRSKETSLKETIVRLMGEKEKIVKDKEELDFKIIGLRCTIQDTKKIDIEKLKKAVNSLNDKIAQRDSISERINKDYERSMKMNAIMANKPSIRDYESEISKLNKKLKSLAEDSSVCPAGDKCPFIIPIKNQILDLEEQIQEKISLLSKQDKEIKEYQDKIAELGVPDVTEEDRRGYKALCDEIKTLEDSRLQLDRAETRNASLPELEKEMASINKECAKLDEGIFVIEGEIDRVKEKLNEITSTYMVDVSGIEYNVKQLKTRINAEVARINMIDFLRQDNLESAKKINALQEEINAKNEEVKALTAIKEAFGNKGLKSVAIDYLIPRLEDKINEILSKLSDFKVRLDTQRSTADGEGTIEGLYINIINDLGEELDYLNYSGGEKLKITVAISEALASLQKVGFRILDELFVGLDEESVDGFATIVDKLNNRFRQMICISHLKTIKDMFEEKISISKINGTSVIQK